MHQSAASSSGCGVGRATCRGGELRNFTGIDSVYEAPEHAELVIDAVTTGSDEAPAKVEPSMNRRGPRWVFADPASDEREQLYSHIADSQVGSTNAACLRAASAGFPGPPLGLYNGPISLPAIDTDSPTTSAGSNP